MRYLKIFESFSKEEWKKRFLEASNLLEILYDLKEVSLEYLDVRHRQISDEGEQEILDKKIIFAFDLHDREAQFLGNLCSGQYSLEDTEIEENLYWSDDIEDPIEDIEEGFKSGKLYLSINFCIVTGEDGDLSPVNSDTANVFQRISDMYPEAEFDTFNPWDLN